MHDPEYDTRAASQMLDEPVRFIRTADGLAIRAIVGVRRARWATPTEWSQFVRQDLGVATPAPIRPREEDACPCPGCGRCTCPWIDEGLAQCSSKTCICPRQQAPVHVDLNRVNAQRVDLELRRGGEVLY